MTVAEASKLKPGTRVLVMLFINGQDTMVAAEYEGRAYGRKRSVILEDHTRDDKKHFHLTGPGSKDSRRRFVTPRSITLANDTQNT